MEIARTMLSLPAHRRRVSATARALFPTLWPCQLQSPRGSLLARPAAKQGAYRLLNVGEFGFSFSCPGGCPASLSSPQSRSTGHVDVEMDCLPKWSLREGRLSCANQLCTHPRKGRQPSKTALPSSLRDRDIPVSLLPAASLPRTLAPGLPLALKNENGLGWEAAGNWALDFFFLIKN